MADKTIGELPNLPAISPLDLLVAQHNEEATKVSGATLTNFFKDYIGPVAATSASQMTNTNKVYIYIGNEAGYTNGNWYYYNGSSWVSGGAYNSQAVNTDATLTHEGVPADAEAAGKIVEISETQPAAPANRVWIPETQEATVQVPTWAEHQELNTAITSLNSGVVHIAPNYSGATDINSIAQAAIARMQANNSALIGKLFTFLAEYASGEATGYFSTSSFHVICKYSSANYGYGLLLSDNSKNIASFKTQSGTTTLFPIGDLQTYTTITPDRASGIVSSVDFVSNYCRKWGKIVKYTASLQSKTSSDVTVTHSNQIITGLPKPDGSLIFMCDTYRSASSANDRKPYRVQLNTDGTITAYWDSVVIPKYGEALLIDIVYMSND